MSTVAADPLSTPLELPCGARLGNRLAKAAMSEQLGDRGNAPTDELARLYARWGAGGAGLLITGNVMVSRGHLGEPRNVVVDDARDLVALRAWAAAARAGGAACWVQINHPGRQAARGLGEHCVAPSAVALKLGPLFATPRPLADAEIEALIAAYARTARIVVAAGFDGVQLHAAHGYLVSQFLSPLTNRRTDRWGGPLEHRMRFALRCVEAMRAAVGPDVPVSVKLNSADFQRGGFSEEESVEVVGALAGAGVDLLEISGGTYERPAMSTGLPTSTAAREAYFLDYAERVREVAPALPLMVTGGFRTAAGMRAALAGGATDVVGLARPLATVPEACAELLAAREVPLPSHRARLGVPALDPAIDTAWHTRQLQRMGRGEAPRSDEPAWRTAIATVVDNGWSAFRRRRG